MKRRNFIKSNINVNKTKRALCESIQKNKECIDFLKDLETKMVDNYKFTESSEDELRVHVVQWILFNMQFNTNKFEEEFKRLGGVSSEFKEPIKW